MAEVSVKTLYITGQWYFPSAFLWKFSLNSALLSIFFPVMGFIPYWKIGFILYWKIMYIPNRKLKNMQGYYHSLDQKNHTARGVFKMKFNFYGLT